MMNYSETFQQAVAAMKDGILNDDENASYFAAVLYDGSLTPEEREAFKLAKAEVIGSLKLPF